MKAEEEEEEEDDEEDYMSDKFLQNEAKPGLMPKLYLDKHKRKESAKRKPNKNYIAKYKPIKVQEAEKRKEKLHTALDESNKGFAMLAKMGFKKGTGLGKAGQGISEPIPLELKTGRGGLGKDSEDERKRTKRMQAYAVKFKRRKEDETLLRGDFESRMRNKINERQTMADLFKSQKACEQLDTSKRITEPSQSWYWPKVRKEEEEEEDEEAVNEDSDDKEEELENCEKLSILTGYLRSQHFYCIWCGITFNNCEDVDENCPGDTFVQHQD